LLTLARNYDWAANSEHLVNVGLAALLAGMRRPGSRVLTVMVAAVLAFMGAAAISVPRTLAVGELLAI